MPRPETGASFATRLIDWQRTHGRHTLPWQNTRDPYRVWLSEIMLQQTQVATVLGYYERFLQRFPDVAALAAASLDDVFALWSGLGYYSRARNLHACAQAVVTQHGGRFPAGSAALMTLPGIGRSTAAAIAAFCFGERVAILDGNVKRVLTRVLAFEGDLAEAKQERALWAEATALLPERDIESYTQGLMDLGATLCTQRSPACLLCPVHALCAAEHAGTPQRYPVKTRKLKRGTREHVWLWLRSNDEVWLGQRPATGVWAGLWSLPEFESRAAFDAASAGWPGAAESLPSFTHVLTHLDWTLHPVRWTLPERLDAAQRNALTSAWPAGRWFGLDEALALGLPAPLRKLLLAHAAPADPVS
ncbi:A/G-specific adenine glycosylase [Rhizobacter sp. Root404]|uniref:A/G-specific adenine glycosylase n=1 Tax=Rhizobacter sp. Root404 TaxID=1736528 RepID=UPI0006F6D00F|nr:A/G-specific adenine glycosylase [Rhizobacter sp. Root404]KQW38554.1 A/G-specific adenine glycosylase [Rhizobacter sp. Root404]